MVRFGIQAALEQQSPAELLKDVAAMDRHGVERCRASDHYMPWWHTGGQGGRNPDALAKVLFIPASYDPDRQKALESIGYWRGAMVKAFFEANFPDPRKIEESAQVVGMDTMEKMALVVSSVEEAIKKLDKYVRLGFTDIVLTNSSPDGESFVRLLTREIAPAFQAARAASAI